jgi:hypothetical protein
LRGLNLKVIAPILFVLGVLLLLALNQPANAAPPTQSPGNTTQENGIILTQQSASDTATVQLGQPVTFTISIKNENDRPVSGAA